LRRFFKIFFDEISSGGKVGKPKIFNLGTEKKWEKYFFPLPYDKSTLKI